MTDSATDLTPRQAQELMSQLLDGELSPIKAEQLYTYLTANPKAVDWMESIDAIRNANTRSHIQVDNERAAQQVLASIKESPKKATNGLNSGSIINFPKLLRPLAAAAAIAIVGIVSWNGLQESVVDETEFLDLQGSQIEFVSTDIPDASPIVYTNDETGWTVVWVEQMDPIPEEV